MKSLLLFLTLICAASMSMAATVSSTFENDTEGWSGIGMLLTQVDTGGNPDGYLEIKDSDGALGSIVAPTKFLTFDDGDVFSFDYITFSGGGTFTRFGTVHITGNGQTVSRDLAPTQPSFEWQTASGDLTADYWGVTQAEWTAIIGDLTMIRIETEAVSGGETHGIDNISISIPAVVPLPGAGAMLLGGLGLLGLGARRSQRYAVKTLNDS